MLKYKNIILDVYNSNILKEIAFSAYQDIGISSGIMQEITNCFVIDEFNRAVLKAREILFKRAPEINNIKLSSNFKAAEQETANIIYSFLKDEINIADIGFGRGFLLDALQKLMPDSNLWGIDITFKYRQVTSDRIKYILNDQSGTLPFSQNSLNAAISVDVFHHINDQVLKNLMFSIYSSLSNNGVFFFVDNVYYFNEKISISQRFNLLSDMEIKLLYAYTEIISHFIIAQTDMPLELNLKSTEEWVSLFESFLFKCVYKGALPIFPHKLHGFPKCMLIFKKE